MRNDSGLNSMRRIAAIAVLLLMSCLRDPSSAAILLDRVVAVIDRDVITWSELYRAVSFEYETQTRGMPQERKKEFLEARQVPFLDRLIVMRLILAKAREAGIAVSDAEVNAAIRDIRTQYNLSEEQFKEALNREGFVYDDYVQRIRDQILMSKVVNSEVRSKIVVTDDELDKFIAENPDLAMPDMIVQLAEIHFRNPRNDEERQQIEAFLDRIKTGGSGGLLAAGHDIEGSPLVVYAGETDMMPSVDLRKDFLTTIRDTDVGKISDPIRADDGIFIFEVLKKELLVSNEEIRDNIRKTLMESRTEKRYEEWIRTLKQGAFIEVKL